MNTLPPIQLNDLFDVQALVEQYPTILTETALRWQLRSRATNGLSSSVVKIGKTLFISKSRYESWLATQAESVQ